MPALLTATPSQRAATLTPTVSATPTATPSAESHFTKEDCIDGTAAAAPLENTTEFTSSVFENLGVLLGTSKRLYAAQDACVPVSLVVMNRGVTSISLSEAQAQTLGNLLVGVYANSILFQSPLLYRSGPPIQPGSFLMAGANSTQGTIVNTDRIALYTVPPLGGGTVSRELSIQGPQGGPITGVPMMPPLGKITGSFITVEVDFGILPSCRVPEPGAGIDFNAGSVFIKFKDGVPLAEAEEVVHKHSCHIDQNDFSLGTAFTLSIPFDRTTVEVVAEFRVEPTIQYAAQDFITCAIPEGCPPVPTPTPCGSPNGNR